MSREKDAPAQCARPCLHTQKERSIFRGASIERDWLGIGADALFGLFHLFFCSLSILSQPHAIVDVWVGYCYA